MAVINPALRALLREIDHQHLSPCQSNVREKRTWAEDLIRALHSGPEEMFQIKQYEHHGSLSRGTGLANFDDWDTIIILDTKALRTEENRRPSPQSTISEFAEAVKNSVGMIKGSTEVEVRQQDHSIGVDYLEHAFRVDLVPGIRSRGKLLIPERDTSKWISTQPKIAHVRLLEAGLVSRDTIPAVRLLKGWARTRGKSNFALSSFALETFVVDQMLNDNPHLEDVVLGLIERLAKADGDAALTLLGRPRRRAAITLVDPVSRNNLTATVTAEERSAVVSAAVESWCEIERLRQSLERGEVGAASELAMQLFVGRERGMTDKPVTNVAYGKM